MSGTSADRWRKDGRWESPASAVALMEGDLDAHRLDPARPRECRIDIGMDTSSDSESPVYYGEIMGGMYFATIVTPRQKNAVASRTPPSPARVAKFGRPIAPTASRLCEPDDLTADGS